MNRQEINIYVAMAGGLYLYDAKGHALQPILTKDILTATGQQPFVTNAPVNLIHVADGARTGKMADEDKARCSAAAAGFIGQNVCLFCAPEGLATVVHGSVDRPALAKTMKLRPRSTIILARTVGCPKK
jgi:nitroreductase